MLAETSERQAHAVECLEIADRAEETQHRVIAVRQVKIAHVCFEEAPGGMFGLGCPEQPRVEVEAVNGVAARGQQARMLAGAAGHVEHGSAAGIDAAQERVHARRFCAVVLE